ncbi:MAG: threonylcarbamoyl-AMP synthase [Rhodospirillaceae bacterium]|nr:threonylcarbamoyl-AMP synthase [Rhodospirillaceae bacterium]
MHDKDPECPTEIVDAGAAGIARAAAILRAGGLVGLPTETVYGLAADATSDAAVAAIFAVKARPRFNPLIVHVLDEDDAARIADFDARAELLAETFWPGPLTLVLRRRAGCAASLLVSAGLDTLAVRAPAHPVARRVIAAAGLPLAAPSANRFGRVSPTDPRHVMEELSGRIPLILAGGRASVGVESTVVDLTGARPRLLRPGGVTQDEITALLGPLETAAEGESAPHSPGRLPSHYAPATPLRLDAGGAQPGEALLTFGPDLRQGDAVRNLSEKGDLAEAAANLFAMLRDLDRLGRAAIAVAPIPATGLGAAINDRLRRAAAPRPVPADPGAPP